VIARALAAMVLASFLIGACAQASCGCLPPVTVFGAASLADTLADARATYEATGPIVLSTGSSTALRTQIEQGADADVFLSADTDNPQTLADAGLTDAAPVAFATNELTVVVPADNPANIQSPADLARPGVRVIAAGTGVPITRYAEQLVSQLGGLSEYPAKFFDLYQGNVVSREDNVGAVISKIRLGEGDAAIVYVTDATAASLDTVAIPDEANVVATYAGAVLKSSTHLAAAHAFLDWLRGTEGQRILAQHGFSPTP
jgi:molybdate transport system substrate-binding protein